MKKHLNFHIMVFLAVCILAAALRFFQLSAESLWFDETVTAWRIRLPWNELFKNLFSIKNHGPLHYTVLKIWCGIFHVSEFHLRFPSAVCGAGTVVFVYLAGRKLFSKSTGLLAAFLVCISQYNIQYSQEARFYSINTFLTLVSMYFFIRIFLFEERSKFACLGYILASTAMLYNHYFSGFLLIAQFAFILIDWVSGRKTKAFAIKSLSLAALPIILFLPWIKVVYSGAVTYSKTKQTVIQMPSILDIPGAFKTYCGEDAFAGLILICCMIIAVAAVFLKRPSTSPGKNKAENNRGRKMILMILWISFPILMPFVLSYTVKPVFSHRYNGAAVSGFFILAAYGLLCIKPAVLRKGLIAVVTVLMIYATYGYFTTVNNQQWRQAVNYIESNAEPGDTVIFSRGYYRIYAYNYYSRRDDLIYDDISVKRFIGRLKRADNPEKVWEKYKATSCKSGSLWLVLMNHYEENQEVVKALTRLFGKGEHKPYVRIDVYHYSLPRPNRDPSRSLSSPDSQTWKARAR